MNRRAGSVVLLATAACVLVLDVEVPALTEPGAGARALASMRAMLSGLASPDLSAAMLGRLATLATETVAIAVFGTGLGAAAGLLLAMAAVSAKLRRAPSRLHRILCEGVWLGLDTLRALPDFVWALALLVVLGPGPITGALAIAVSVTGILGRAFGQLLRSVPTDEVRTVEGGAAPPLAALVYGRLPRIAPAAWSYGLARLECSMRNASVIGVVGGGGLGAELFEELGYGRMDRVATLLLGLLALTLTADIGASLLRRRLTSLGLRPRRRARRAALVLFGVCAVALADDWVTLSDTVARLDPRVATDSVARLLRPALDRAVLREVASGIASPLALAWLSTLTATGLAMLALPWTSTLIRRRSRGPNAPPSPVATLRAWALRGLALVARGVPEVAWLLLLAAAFGMGAAPALLALTLHAAGVLVRLFTEAVDDAFATRPHAGPGAGAGPGWLAYVALPRLRPALKMHAGLQAESNLRTAYALGMLGAGGLGESFSGAMSFWQLERASTIALGMIVVFVVLDRIGRRLSQPVRTMLPPGAE